MLRVTKPAIESFFPADAATALALNMDQDPERYY